MEATPVRFTLLGAAKNFIRKSAGTTVLVIVPLAAVSLAPEAKAQTIFGSPGITIGYDTGSASITDSFSPFFSPGSVANNLTTTRLGVDGTFTTTDPGSATISILVSSAISGQDIPISTVIPLAYDFTLSKQAGTIGNVTWNLQATISGDSAGYQTISSGNFNSSPATFTGTYNYTTSTYVSGGGAKTLDFYLKLNYSTLAFDVLAFQMNSAGQGYTINAVAVPESSTYAAIFGLGALGLVLVRRSRRAAA
ncbi:MAG: PEP-CTERM sorting domain-containing protein [Lacunisphaera sp.]|nr:PEP-CTERM sorting domain-containing protein [Lacunisphaera sp.]